MTSKNGKAAPPSGFPDTRNELANSFFSLKYSGSTIIWQVSIVHIPVPGDKIIDKLIKGDGIIQHVLI